MNWFINNLSGLFSLYLGLVRGEFRGFANREFATRLLCRQEPVRLQFWLVPSSLCISDEFKIGWSGKEDASPDLLYTGDDWNTELSTFQGIVWRFDEVLESWNLILKDLNQVIHLDSRVIEIECLFSYRDLFWDSCQFKTEDSILL